MGYWGKKISFYTYLLARIAFFIMAISMAYLFICSGAKLKLVKFPLIGGELQTEYREKLPEDVIKVAVNEAKYIFNDEFIIEVEPSDYQPQSNNYFEVSFYKINYTEDTSLRDISKSNRTMTPGSVLSICHDSIYYNVRMMQIKKKDEQISCYFHIYTDVKETNL